MRSSYKRARLRDITGRWPRPEGATPGRREYLHDVPRPEKSFLGGNELVDDARSRIIPKSAHKTKRSKPNTRRGATSGQARFNRGRKRVIERR